MWYRQAASDSRASVCGNWRVKWSILGVERARVIKSSASASVDTVTHTNRAPLAQNRASGDSCNYTVKRQKHLNVFIIETDYSNGWVSRCRCRKNSSVNGDVRQPIEEQKPCFAVFCACSRNLMSSAAN